MNIRAAIERFSQGFTFRRKLPHEFGARRLWVSPECALRFWLPGGKHYDPLFFRLAQEFVKPGMIVWDVGANVGLFSFAAAAMAGEAGSVLAIEADPWIASLLARTAAVPFQNHAQVAVLPAAISDSVGIAPPAHFPAWSLLKFSAGDFC